MISKYRILYFITTFINSMVPYMMYAYNVEVTLFHFIVAFSSVLLLATFAVVDLYHHIKQVRAGRVLVENESAAANIVYAWLVNILLVLVGVYVYSVAVNTFGNSIVLYIAPLSLILTIMVIWMIMRICCLCYHTIMVKK